MFLFPRVHFGYLFLTHTQLGFGSFKWVWLKHETDRVTQALVVGSMYQVVMSVLFFEPCLFDTWACLQRRKPQTRFKTASKTVL